MEKRTRKGRSPEKPSKQGRGAGARRQLQPAKRKRGQPDTSATPPKSRGSPYSAMCWWDDQPLRFLARSGDELTYQVTLEEAAGFVGVDPALAPERLEKLVAARLEQGPTVVAWAESAMDSFESRLTVLPGTGWAWLSAEGLEGGVTLADEWVEAPRTLREAKRIVRDAILNEEWPDVADAPRASAFTFDTSAWEED